MRWHKAAFLTREMLEIFFRCRVSRAAAELSYYLTFSIFPTLICLYTLLSRYFSELEDMLASLERFLPTATMDILLQFLDYVSRNSSKTMLTAAVILMASSSAAVFRSLHSIMADIQGRPRFHGGFYMLVSFLFALVLLCVMYFAVIVMITGNWFLRFIDQHIPFLSISSAWNWLRFVLLFGMVLLVLYGLYRLLAPPHEDETAFPGALAATAALVAMSIIMSFCISMFSRYPLVYGSLASIVILMLWLNVCGVIIIMGNALNVCLRRWKAGQTPGAEPIEPRKTPPAPRG